MIASLLGSWGQIGVVLFVIITSWFSADRKGIHSIKAVTIALQAWMTSVIVLIIGSICLPSAISVKLALKEIMTPVVSQYWFVTTFIVFYLILPLLQKLVSDTDVTSLKFICLLLTPLIPIYNYMFQNVGGALADFIYIFLLIAYLKKKPNNWFEKHRHLALLGLLLLEVLIIGLKLTFTYLLPGHDNIFITLYQNLRGRTLITIGVSVLIFYCFKNYKIGYNKWINIIGKATFGIYLLHENFVFRPCDGHTSLLWAGLFHLDWWYKNSIAAGVIHIIAVMLVFIICIPLSLLLEKAAGLVTTKRVTMACNWIDMKYKNFLK